jgi:hypothetical protein
MTPTAHVKGVRPRHAVRTPARTEPEPIVQPAYDKPLSQPDAPQPVLSIHGCVDGSEVPAFIRAALQEIRAHIEHRHLEVQGSPFYICRPASPYGVEVEVGWPVGQASGKGRISSGGLPTGLVRRGQDRTTREGATRLA